MSEGTSGEKPKKKPGRPKSTKNKPKSKKTTKTAKIKQKASDDSLTPKEIAAIAEVEAKAAQARLADAKAVADAAAEKEHEAVAAEIQVPQPVDLFTDKRGSEHIFRREMGEPEFWLTKEGRAPKFTILSQDEEQEISRKVEIPTDQIPVYKPEHILSPEFDGTSNYELAIKNQKEELQQRLERLKNDPNSSAQESKL
jgi:colicin import membrane protein